MDRPTPSIAWASIGILALVLPATVYLMASDFFQGNLKPPVTVYEARLERVDGRNVWVEFRAARHRDCALETQIQWKNRNGVLRTKVGRNKAILPPGEESWLSLRIELPKSLSGGPYSVRSVGEYVCPDGRVFAVPTGWVDVILR